MPRRMTTQKEMHVHAKSKGGMPMQPIKKSAKPPKTK